LASFFENDGVADRQSGDGEAEIVEDMSAGAPGRSGAQPAESRYLKYN
jgi:hypothetical protein